MGSPARVVIVGSGFGGLETAFNLHMLAGTRAEITLVSDTDHFLFKPNSIYVPFGLDPDRLRVPVAAPLAKRGIGFIRGRAEGIDPAAGALIVDGRALDYDYAVLATGSGMRPDEIPGLAEHSESIWTASEMLSLRERFASLADAARRGERRHVHFVVAPNNKCAGPLYEIVLMLDTWLRRHGARESVTVEWSTFESGFIQAFGPRLDELVREEFARRGIEGHTERVLERVEPGAVSFAGGAGAEHDLLVSFPPYVAATRFAGLPADERGFLRTDLATRQVADRVFAAGDAGDFPVKQAFLAFLQADSIATRIAAELGAASAEDFDPVSMCVMEQFDKATFAQVPLRLTGEADRPVEVRPDADGDYRVGSNVAWRAGKKLLGHAVPWRFAHGLPFHAGGFWTGMDLGLRGMSRVLAR